MYKVEIKKNNIVTHSATFLTEAQAAAWKDENADFFPQGFEFSCIDIAAQLVAAKEKSDALAYLNSTDWYIIRSTETAVAVPEEVLTLRAAARLKA